MRRRSVARPGSGAASSVSREIMRALSVPAEPIAYRDGIAIGSLPPGQSAAANESHQLKSLSSPKTSSLKFRSRMNPKP